MELEALDREQRELYERAAKIDVAAAVNALPDPLPLSAWKFLLGVLAGPTGWMFASASDVDGFVAKVAAFSNEFEAANGRRAEIGDFVAAFGTGVIAGIASFAAGGVKLSDAAALGVFNGAVPSVGNGGSSFVSYSVDGGASGLVFGGGRGTDVEIERLPDGTFVVRVTEKVRGSASVAVGGEGHFRVNEHEFAAGASAEAGVEAEGTRSSAFKFDPSKAGDMTKMAGLIAGIAAPGTLASLQTSSPNLKDNLVEYEVGVGGGLFAEGHASDGRTSAAAAASAGGTVTRRMGDQGWETVVQGDVAGEAGFSAMGLSAKAAESYSTEHITRDNGQDLVRRTVTTTDRSTVETVAQASLEPHERYIWVEEVDKASGVVTTRIYAEDDISLGVEASAKLGLKAHVSAEGSAEVAAGTRRLIYEGTR